MSKKFSKNIRKAEKVIEKIIGGGSYVDYEYDYSEPNYCVWSAIQPETSDILTGSYNFNNKGIVTSHSYTVRTSSTPDLFVTTELTGGKKSFKKNAKAHNKAYELGYVSDIVGSYLESSDAQPLANFFDTLPGADDFFNSSTAVAVGEDAWGYA